MVNRERLEKKARVALDKAERLLDNDRIKRSADQFRKAGEYFQKLENWKVAEQCFYYASKNYITLGSERDFHRAALMQRYAANCCIELDLFEKAKDYFNVAGKSILKSDAKEMYQIATRNFGFAFLCYFIQGEIEDAITFVKRIKKKIPASLYTDHKIMHLVRKITNAYLKQKEQYLDDIIDHLGQYKYNPAEMYLIKETLIVSLAALMMDYKIILNETEFERDSIVEVDTQLDYSRLKEFKKYTIVPRTFKSVKIIKQNINISENIGTKSRPNLPLELNLHNFKSEKISYSFRNNYPGEAFIGPIELTIQVDGKYEFVVKSNKQPISIVSPQAILGVNLIPIKTPVINQTFPLEVIVSNQSDGNAMEIEVEFEFPEDLKMMRGTFTKKIYSLSPNEEIKWSINVKAIDVGEIPIKTIVSFKDGDGNDKGPYTAELPLEINL